jgi:hypothetical protein
MSISVNASRAYSCCRFSSGRRSRRRNNAPAAAARTARGRAAVLAMTDPFRRNEPSPARCPGQIPRALATPGSRSIPLGNDGLPAATARGDCRHRWPRPASRPDTSWGDHGERAQPSHP